MKKRQFFSGLSWLILLNLLIKPAWIFFIDREVQNTVGHEAYGSYFALLNLCLVLLFVADAGLSNMLVQQMAANKASDAAQMVWLKLTLLLLYLLACIFAGWLTGITNWPVLLHVMFIQALGSLFIFSRNLLTAHQLFKHDAFFSVADKALMIILCSVFLYGWLQPITITIFLQLQLFAFVAANLLLLSVLLRRRLFSPLKIEKTALRLVRQMAPFAIIVLLMGMHYRLDGFLLERLREDGALQAGIYATAYRLLDAANMIGYLTASFLIAFVARNKSDKPLIQSVLNFLQPGLLSVAIAAGCFALVFPTAIQEILYHTNDPFNDRVIQLCLAVLPAYYIIHLYGTVLTALAHLRVFIRIMLFAVLTNIILNLLLIPHSGAVGSSVAALVSQYGCAVACYFAATNKLSFPPSIKPWLLYGSAASGLFLLLVLLKMAIHSVWIILVAVALLLLVIVLAKLKSLKSFVLSFIQQTHA